MLEGVGFPARCGGGAREFQTEYGIIVLLDQKRKLAPRPPPTILRDPKLYSLVVCRCGVCVCARALSKDLSLIG